MPKATKIVHTHLIAIASAVAAAIVILVFGTTAVISREEESASTPTKTLRIALPPKVSLGGLQEKLGGLDSNWAVATLTRTIGNAKGVFEIPDNGKVLLSASYDVVANPELLNTLPPNALGSISFKNMGALSSIDSITGPVGRLTGLRKIDLTSCEISDAALAKLSPLRNLRCLLLGFADIRGTCFKDWQQPNLEWLDLSNNTLAPEVFGYLSKYQNLRVLYLDHTGLNDAGLEEVCKLKKLEKLYTQKNRITAKGLKNLAGLKSLRHLDLRGTPCTVEELTQLRGTSLTSMDLSMKCSPEQLKQLAPVFPHTKLLFQSFNLEPDEKEIFAPLH